MASNNKDKRNPEALSSIIGADAVLEGSLTLDGSVRVDGAFNGVLICGGAVTVGKHGSIIGDIEADEVILGGRVNGTVVARRRITLEGSSVLEGEIATASLLISEGAVFNGLSSMGEEAVEKLRSQQRESRGTPQLRSGSPQIPEGEKDKQAQGM